MYGMVGLISGGSRESLLEPLREARVRRMRDTPVMAMSK